MLVPAYKSLDSVGGMGSSGVIALREHLDGSNARSRIKHASHSGPSVPFDCDTISLYKLSKVTLK